MIDSDDLFSHINTAILDLQASGLQNFHRPIKRLSQLLHHQDLRAVNQQLTAIVDVDGFLQVSYQTGGSMAGSQKLLWPDNIKEQLGLFLGVMDKLAADENFAIQFASHFFYSGSKIISGIRAMTRDLIIPFAREYKQYVLSGGQSDERLVIPASNKVFIVHGHDEGALQGLARFLEKLGLEAIVLREQPDKGRTLRRLQPLEFNGIQLGRADHWVWGTPLVYFSLGRMNSSNIIFEQLP